MYISPSLCVPGFFGFRYVGAAVELDQEGQNRTLARVRKKLGGGSFTTIREQMASLRGELQAVTLCHQEIMAVIKQKTAPAQ